jgi:hypothetical protein
MFAYANYLEVTAFEPPNFKIYSDHDYVPVNITVFGVGLIPLKDAWLYCVVVDDTGSKVVDIVADYTSNSTAICELPGEVIKQFWDND